MNERKSKLARYATLYENCGTQFVGDWWPTREVMMDARAYELALEPNTRAVAAIKGIAR